VQYLRGKGEFRLRSRWMLVFDLARNGWGALQARIHGHEHRPSAHSTQYGRRTAFGVGMIHGIGAETGSQALLLAGIAGVTGTTGIVILLAFVVGLLMSNTLVAVGSASGFIGAQRMRTLYVIVGAVAGVASLVIGALFLVGLGTALPDLSSCLRGEPKLARISCPWGLDEFEERRDGGLVRAGSMGVRHGRRTVPAVDVACRRGHRPASRRSV
jgi:hypothetical protein